MYTIPLGTVLILGLLVAAPPVVSAVDRKVDCNIRQSINAAINTLMDGDTVKISGNCSENITINERSPNNITLDGGGAATISGPDVNQSVVEIFGRRAIVQNFASITGGNHGIHVGRSAVATIRGNTIETVGGHGILINEHSEARITNNFIQNNVEGSGILVTEHSSARIGVNSTSDTVARPNTVTNNGTSSGNSGISVSETSFATITGNTISNNGTAGTIGGHGISVVTGSSAEIASNTINGNAEDAVLISRNSAVRLGRDRGTGIFEAPNQTTLINGRAGVNCSTLSSADGRLGTLNGTVLGPKSFDSSCVDSLR